MIIRHEEIPMSYQHLTSSERFRLYEQRFVLKESLSTIAGKMGRAKSTLSRELKRNQISGVTHLVAGVAGMEERQETLYLPDTAEVMAVLGEPRTSGGSQDPLWCGLSNVSGGDQASLSTLSQSRADCRTPQARRG